jgi:hypothetical protein
MHIHPHLRIIIDGQELTIPAEIGIGPLGSQPIHTHDSSGWLHVESTVRYDFRLQDFFTIWGKPFNSQQVLGFRADAAHPITLLVGGVPSTAFGSLILQDHQDIVIIAGAPNGPTPGAPNERYLAQVFQDLLHRKADPSSLGYFTELLDWGTISRPQVAAALATSTEYRTGVVQNLYRRELHRDAGPAELTGMLGFLAGGGTVEQLQANILGSAEYFQNRGGGTSAGFLGALYQDVLGRPADAAGRAAFGAQLAQGISRQQVAQEVLGSVEYRGDLVSRLYRQFLGRPPDAGSQALVDGLGQGMRDEDVIATLVGSDEFFNKNVM